MKFSRLNKSLVFSDNKTDIEKFRIQNDKKPIIVKKNIFYPKISENIKLIENGVSYKEFDNPVWIVATLRSGSTYLSSILDKIIIKDNTNDKLRFVEHFNPVTYEYSYYCREIYKKIYEKFNFSRKENYNLYKLYIKNSRTIIKNKLYPKYNKIFPEHIQQWKKSDFINLKENLPKLKCIHLIRRDIYNQTVSLYLAEKTKEWAFHNNQNNKIKNYLKCHIDFDKNYILQLYNNILYEKQRCFNVIDNVECPFHTVYYEDLCENLDFELEKICDFLHINKEKIKLIHTEKFKNKSLKKVTHPLKDEYVKKLKNIIEK